MPVWQFYEWKKRLRQPEPASFIAVEVSRAEVTARPAPYVKQISGIELRHRRGWNLIVEPGFDAGHLRRLQWKQQLLPKHPMAEAINYALVQWLELNVFCSDGAVPIDNNVSEREMKRVVLNRKNSLFVGNARGGRTAAVLSA